MNADEALAQATRKLKSDRYKANLALIETLKAVVLSDQGEQRFSQILRNYGFVLSIWGLADDNVWADEFNLEPKLLLERVNTECSKVFGK